MYILGHAGITLYAARAVDPEIDWRAPVALSLLPDALDKPVRWLWPHLVHFSTRNYGHTLLAWLAVLAVCAALRGRLKHPWLLWACFAGHAVLDRMWLGENVARFFWPLLGPFPPPTFSTTVWTHAFIYDVIGEAIGLALLLRLAAKGKAAPEGGLSASKRTD